MVVRCEHLRVIGLLTQDYCPLVMVLLAALVDPFQRSISLSIVAREQGSCPADGHWFHPQASRLPA
jgi:hypothetical protein